MVSSKCWLVSCVLGQDTKYFLFNESEKRCIFSPIMWHNGFVFGNIMKQLQCVQYTTSAFILLPVCPSPCMTNKEAEFRCGPCWRSYFVLTAIPTKRTRKQKKWMYVDICCVTVPHTDESQKQSSKCQRMRLIREVKGFTDRFRVTFNGWMDKTGAKVKLQLLVARPHWKVGVSCQHLASTPALTVFHKRNVCPPE